MIKVLNKLGKDFLDECRLHFWWNLVVEAKLLNYHIEIIIQGIFNCLHNFLVQNWGQEVWFVRDLDFVNP